MEKEATCALKNAEQKDNALKLLERASVVLEDIASSNEPKGIREISASTKLPVATVYRIANKLCHVGWLTQENDTKYRIGLKAYLVGKEYNQIEDLRKIASYTMQKTSNVLQQPVNLMIRDGKEAFLIEQTSCKLVYNTLSPIGSRRPLYLTACGKVIMSDMLPTEIEMMLDAFDYHPYTPYSPTDKETIRKQLEQIRKNGWALDNQEAMLGAFCVATGIRRKGRIIAGLSVTSVIAHENNLELYVEHIKKAASEIEKNLEKYWGDQKNRDGSCQEDL